MARVKKGEKAVSLKRKNKFKANQSPSGLNLTEYVDFFLDTSSQFGVNATKIIE